MESDGLSPGAVSRRLGIAVTTLRTWHQRYGLGPSGHAHGSHRRYNAEDLVRLETMRRLTSEGVPAAEAARIARTGDVDSVRTARAGGGHAIPVGRAGPQARGLARAATRLDMPTVRSIVAAAVAEHGVVAAWTELLVPVLVGIGKRHEATQRLIDVEHLLSRCVAEVLGSVPRPAAGSASTVLLACADEEQHSLPLEALAAALAERGVGCHLLGARVPLDALLDAVRRTGPAMVVLWSQTSQTADTAQLSALLDLPHRPALVVAAGPGWGENLPPAALTPTSLAEALSLAVAVS
ncbi:MerR family transcriptional regulator [Rhizocola hellebori]|uniref:MerR family transcriptional regulator n=1 Tax=Rhizocola hellebori TaxID=1392758 RepID=UPI001943921C|nr:MerR family transcriptional regulator [Rhizocola hellebori]